MKPGGWMGVAVLWAVVSSACCPLEPFGKVRARLPEREYVDLDGQAVHFLEWGRGGTPVLMIHGFGQSSYTFREIGPLLGDGRRVLAPDLNGFGYTERVADATDYSPAGQTSLLDRFAASKDLERFDVIAHSYGCELALRLAAEHPGRVRKLVLISPALNMDVPEDSMLRSRAVRGLLYPGLRYLLCDVSGLRDLYERAYFRTDKLTGESLAEYRRQLLVEGLHRAYRGFGEAISTMKDGRVGIDAVSQPILILGGNEDMIIPSEALPPSKPGRRRVLLENAGHIAPEEVPIETARAILGFLAGR